MLLANFTLRGELKFGMPASPTGSRLRRGAVSSLREGKWCELILWEKSKNLCGREQCYLTIPEEVSQLRDRAVLTSVMRLVKEVFRVLLEWSWCYLTSIARSRGLGAPCIVPLKRGLMPWRKHPNPGLFGHQRGFLCLKGCHKCSGGASQPQPQLGIGFGDLLLLLKQNFQEEGAFMACWAWGCQLWVRRSGPGCLHPPGSTGAGEGLGLLPSLATQGVWDLQPLWGEGRAMQLGSILGRCQITAQAVYYSFSLMIPSTCLKCYHFVVCFTRA